MKKWILKFMDRDWELINIIALVVAGITLLAACLAILAVQVGRL